MSYELRVWDPTRHQPLPTSADEAIATMERLDGVDDTRNPTLEKFGTALVRFYEAEPYDSANPPIGVEAFWGSDPRAGTAACRTAVYHLSLPSEECTTQMVFAVEAAAKHGLVLVDDELGMCFLPDGGVFPEDSREMWEGTVAEVKAGPPDPTKPAAPDNRSLLQRIAIALFEEIGRGNTHQS